ncbi:MAG: hypothetical protein NXH85_04330 [Pseudomonadaceae bacterium]|nr:hypothetical protein [Pseudomonadaceae bacterium]
MKSFFRHGLLTAIGTAVLAIAVFAIFGWTEAEREIHAICEFLDNSSQATLSSTLATLEWSDATRSGDTIEIGSIWNLHSSTCALALHDGSVSAQLN